MCQVSKWFRDVTHYPAIWKALYDEVPFMHPPGPFPNVSFEHALVRSARLAQSWTTQGLRVVSCVEFPLEGERRSKLLGGRWFLVYRRILRQFFLYDTHGDAEIHVGQLLWEQEEEIFDWDVHSGVSEEGYCVVYLLMAIRCPERWYVCRQVIPRILVQYSVIGHSQSFSWTQIPARFLAPSLWMSL